MAGLIFKYDNTAYAICGGDGQTEEGSYIWIEKHANNPCSRKGPLDHLAAIPAIQYVTDLRIKQIWEEVIFRAEKILNDSRNKGAERLLKLTFLRICIFILNETGRRFVENPTLLQDIIYLYWTTYQNPDGSHVPDYLAIDVCERYLDLLADDANHSWFERKVVPKEGGGHAEKSQSITRESETEKVAFELLSLKERTKNLDDDQKRRINQALNRAKEMLLTWYNLNTSEKITFSLRGRRVLLRKILSIWLPFFSALLLVAYFLWRQRVLENFGVWLNRVGVNELFSLLEPFWIRFSYGHDPMVIALVYVPVLGLFLSASYKLVSRAKLADFQIHLPLLGAGIIVGYIVLLSTEAWAGIFGEHSWNYLLGRAVLPLVVVYLYILIEMNSVKGIKYPIIWKGLSLLARGWTYSVIAGAVFSDIFGQGIVDSLKKADPALKEPMYFFGLFGKIYPEVVFYLAPLALFIGVFVQLLWEDKRITSKL